MQRARPGVTSRSRARWVVAEAPAAALSDVAFFAFAAFVVAFFGAMMLSPLVGVGAVVGPGHRVGPGASGRCSTPRTSITGYPIYPD
ncbi:hypothetical protein ADK75_13085 [Streptomyces virginiae]|uniref:Uncharacterized protein n=1 Tax=Streptomyces virginiae TaxID=1961 RepID=A0A0L8MWY3_STRVG|nr:hypothetical protein ADK75_13085 [Streptomyces virginiae]